MMHYDNDGHIVGARRRIKEKVGVCGRIQPLGNTLCKLYRYLRRQRIWLLSRLGLK